MGYCSRSKTRARQSHTLMSAGYGRLLVTTSRTDMFEQSCTRYRGEEDREGGDGANKGEWGKISGRGSEVWEKEGAH